MLRRSATYSRLFIASLWLLTSLSPWADAQSSYLKQATISEKDGTVHLLANDSRPLAQALDALQGKYGWRINYERTPSTLLKTMSPKPRVRRTRCLTQTATAYPAAEALS